MADAELVEADDELVGRLAGEREREHVGGLDLLIGNTVGDTTGEHSGFARARAGQDAQRSRVDRDGLALRAGQPGEEVVCHGLQANGRQGHRGGSTRTCV